MRRPLAAAVLLFAAAVRLTTLALPLPVPVPSHGDGQTAVYTGEVADIVSYTDAGTGEAVQILYLKHALPEPETGRQENADPFITFNENAGEGISDRLISFEENPSSTGNSIICRTGSGEIQPEIGSSVRCEGKVRHFRRATNPGEFDAGKYYNRQGYAFELTDVRITGKSREYSRFRQALFRLKSIWEGHWSFCSRAGRRPWQRPCFWEKRREWIRS